MHPETEEFLKWADEERGWKDSTLERYGKALELLSTWEQFEDADIETATTEDMSDLVRFAKERSDYSYLEVRSKLFPAVEKFYDWQLPESLESPTSGVDLDSLLIVDGGKRYLDHIDGVKSESYVKNHRNGLIQFSDWLEQGIGLHPSELVPADIEAYLAHLGGQDYTDGTKSVKYVSVSRLYKYMIKQRNGWDSDPTEEARSQEYIDFQNPVKRKEEIKQDLQFVSEDDYGAMIENVPTPRLRNELLIDLMWQTGMRRGEVSNLEIDDIDRDNRKVWIPASKSKSDESRYVFYEPSLDTKLNLWLDGGERASSNYASETDYLFVTQRSGQLHTSRINMIVRKAAERAGIQGEAFVDASNHSRNRLTAHSLRHGFAVYSLNNGLDLLNLSKIMGHKDLNTTAQYLHYTTDKRRLEYLKSRQSE